MRPSKRGPDEMRPVSFERGLARHAEGSCLVKFGDTHVLVTATLEEKLPPWLKNQGRGWVTAEYGMLPRATHERTRREASAGRPSGRTLEIQRLIGRSLRVVTDLQALGERTCGGEKLGERGSRPQGLSQALRRVEERHPSSLAPQKA